MFLSIIRIERIIKSVPAVSFSGSFDSSEGSGGYHQQHLGRRKMIS